MLVTGKISIENGEVGEDMKNPKTSISKSNTYEEIGKFWDTHDLSEYWEQTDVIVNG